MANNTLWLVHKKTMRGICIGKSMGWGWYTPHMKIEKLQEFYCWVLKQVEQCPDDEDICSWHDGFILLQEDPPGGEPEQNWVFEKTERGEFQAFSFREKKED